MDNAIALQYQPSTALESPLNMMAKLSAIRGSQQENAMRQAQMENYRSEIEKRNAMLPFEQAKARSEQETARIAQDSAASKLVGERLDLARRRLEGVSADAPDADAQYIAWHKQNHRDPVLADYFSQIGVSEDDSLKGILSSIYNPDGSFNREGLRQKITESKLGVDATIKREDERNKPTAIALGGTTEGINARGETVWTRKETQSPDAAARLAETRADSTVMTPEEVDYYANMYNQTNSLPSLGMGSASLRQRILSRAAQIGMAGGATAAEGAANVVSNAQTRAAEKKTLTGFTSGVEARRVTANNTAVNHLATMEALADNLANSDIRILNAAKQAYAKATGSATPASFDAAKQLVAAEVIKAVVNNGGGVKEREEAASQFARANSPEQLKGVIQTYKELLAGQLSSLQQQYETGTGRKDFDSKLSPRVRELLSAGAPAAGGGDLAAAARAELARRRGAQK